MTKSVRVVDPASPAPVTGFALGCDLVVLPHDLDGDCGLYSDQLVTTVKTLREDRIDARWFHDVEHRLWSGERSAIVDLWVIPFIVGISSAAGWAGLVSLLRRRAGKVKVKIGYRNDSLGGEERWVELEGSSPDVAAELERLNPWKSLEPPVDRGETIKSE